MMYIKVDESSTPIPETLYGSKPNWFDSAGNPVTDQHLIDYEGLYPVTTVKPVHDSFYQRVVRNPPEQWVFNVDHVEATYTIENMPLSQIKARLLGELAALRYKYEVGGFIFTDSTGADLKIHSSRESHTKIIGTRQAAQEGLRPENALWKTMEGFVPLRNGDMVALGPALFGFTQACYDRESQIEDLIAAVDTSGDYSTAANEFKTIHADEFTSGWPSNALYQG